MDSPCPLGRLIFSSGLRRIRAARKVWMMASNHKSLLFSLSRQLFCVLALVCLLAPAAHAQPPAPATVTSADSDPRARLLLQQMLTALGGSAYLDIHDTVATGRVAGFFQSAPNGQLTKFVQLHRALAVSGIKVTAPSADRIELTKKRDVIDIFSATDGVEITYKGRQYLPDELVSAYLRRRAHSIESIVRLWLPDPAVAVFYLGQENVGRRLADRVRLVSAQDDAVTLDIDAETHLPLRRTFRWRNPAYKDFDEDSAEYAAYQTVQGFATPFNITRYRNGDMVEQRYIDSVQYNTGLPDSLFDAASVPLPKR